VGCPQSPPPEEFEGTSGGLFHDDIKPDDWPRYPDALLRNPWPGCIDCGFKPEECAGEKYEIISAEERDE